MRPRLLQMDAVGVPQDVRLLLLLRRAAGAAYRRADCRLREGRHRGAERRLHTGTALHGRRMARHVGGAEGADTPELPPRVPRRHDGQLVSETGNRAGQRRSARRTLRPRRPSGRAEADETMAPARDGLRPAHARRTGQTRLERLAERDSAQLDRPLGRRPGLLRHKGLGPKTRDIHHPSRHDFRRDVHGHRPRARVGRRADHTRKQNRRRGVYLPGQEALRARAHRRNEARKWRSDRLLRHQPVHRQGHSDLYF